MTNQASVRVGDGAGLATAAAGDEAGLAMAAGDGACIATGG